MVKRIASILILVLVLVALVVPVAPILGEGPEEEESFSELPVEVQEEIEKQLKNPVKPKIRPPFTKEGKPLDIDVGKFNALPEYDLYWVR